MQNKAENQVYAGFFVRLAAYLIDCIIVGAALLVVRLPIAISSLASPDNFMVKDFIFEYSVADILYYVLGAVYFVLLTYFTGATVGKRLLQIRVISVEDRKMTLFEVAFRETVGKFLSGLVMQVGYLLIGMDKEKRGLHDLLSDTKVIYYHEKRVYTHTPVQYRNMTNTQSQNVVSQTPFGVQENDNVSQAPFGVQQNDNVSQAPFGVQQNDNVSQAPFKVQQNDNVSQTPFGVQQNDNVSQMSSGYQKDVSENDGNTPS